MIHFIKRRIFFLEKWRENLERLWDMKIKLDETVR